MLSRALSLAAVRLLIGCFAAAPGWARAQNLEAGKSPSQIFAGTCTACHKSPRGLLRSVPPGSLQSFLRQHYTTSPEMASMLTAFLISNGAADTRAAGAQAKPGKGAKSEERPAGASEQLDRFGRRLRPAPQEAARPGAESREAAGPDVDGVDPGRHGRDAKRLARPAEAPAADGQAPVQAATERGPGGRKVSARQRLSKRGNPASEEPPKSEAPKSEAAKTEGKTEPAKTDAGKEEPARGEVVNEDTPKGETAKVESGTSEPDRPSAEGKSEAAKIESPKEPDSGEVSPLRADPVPPAPPTSPTVSAAVSSGTPEPAAAPVAPLPSEPVPAVTASAPPPVAPAGPPAPPISQ